MSYQRTERIKIVANLKDKMTENKECQWVTISVLMTGTTQSERGVDETDKKE